MILDQLQALAYNYLQLVATKKIGINRLNKVCGHDQLHDWVRTASAVTWASSMKLSLLNTSSRVLPVTGDSSRWVSKQRETKSTSPAPAPTKCQRRRHVHSRNSCFLLGGRASHHFLMLLETKREIHMKSEFFALNFSSLSQKTKNFSAMTCHMHPIY